MSERVLKGQILFLDDPANTVEKNIRTVETGGSPGVARYLNGWKASIDATDEAQQAIIDWGDDLIFDIDLLKKLTFRAAVETPTANVNVYLGLVTAHNGTWDSITERIAFQFEGSANATVRTDDATNDSGDVATQFSTDGTVQDFTIDLASGIETAIPVSSSKTGKGAVKFFSEANGGGLRKLSKTGMDMSAYAGALQPYIRIDKASGTDTGSVTIYSIDYEIEI